MTIPTSTGPGADGRPVDAALIELGKAYVNHLAADDRPEVVRASFGENYARLRQLKTVYDPTNLFRVNANISPA